MLRSQPPIIKIYEALGAIADQRIEISDGIVITAKVYSSSKEKFYTVHYDPANNAIMMNDNGSYRKGYLWYPGIAVLLLTKKLPLHQTFAEYLKDIARKDINTKNNNDFDATQKAIDIMISAKGNVEQFQEYITSLANLIQQNPLHHLGKKTLPPKGY